MSIVLEKSNWTNKEIKYIKNVTITEYDMKDGGMSIIKEYKLLPDEKIKELDSLEKEEKNIRIGKIQAKSKDLTKNMVQSFGKARELFVTKNNIPDDCILSIKKDALFIVNWPVKATQISENINFRPKHKYSSYMILNNKEFYFSFSGLTVKGFSEENLESQEKYLLSDISNFLNQAEKIQPDLIFNNLKKYSSKYLNKELPIETYRNIDTNEFDIHSEYIGDYSMKDIDESFLSDLDISHNYMYYILPMIKNIMQNMLN